jgi:hypothetical protein
MKSIKIDNCNFLTFKNTEYNTVVLGYKTNEISNLIFSNKGNGIELFTKFEKYCEQNSILYTGIRIKPDYKIQKQVLEELGYHSIETILTVDTMLKNIQENTFLEKFKFTLRKFTSNDIQEIKNIASDDFKYGRFFEDSIIEENVAKLRNSNWIESLTTESEILVGEYNGKVIAFMAFENKQGTVNLKIGGLRFNFVHLAYPFWYKVLIYLKEINTKSVNALISVHNLNILNLYSFFNFKFKESYIGYRKFRK